MDVRRLRVAGALGAIVSLWGNSAWAADDANASAAGAGTGVSMTTSGNAAVAGGAPSLVEAPDAALARIIDRPHTIAELEAGVIALPTAPISPGQRGGNTPVFGKIGKGDATMQIGIHVLYRWSRALAAGAGAIFAPSPTSDSGYGAANLPRSHSRSYLFLGGELRYIPIHYKFFEAWAGVSAGSVIIADRFTTEAGDSVAPILGTKEATIRTEGFALGLQGGASYYFTEHWIGGANLRAYRWMLPDSPRCSPIGDCATLSGAVEAFELGLTVGYRLPL